MKKLLVLALGATLAVAATASAQTEKCKVDIQTCLNNWASVRHAAWVGLEYDKSEPNVLKVKAVTPMSPAAAAGFQPGDIITAVNGADINDKVALKKARGEWASFQAVTYTIRRGTDEKMLNVTLGEMPAEVFAATVGQHMLDDHVGGPQPVADKAPSKKKK